MRTAVSSAQSHRRAVPGGKRGEGEERGFRGGRGGEKVVIDWGGDSEEIGEAVKSVRIIIHTNVTRGSVSKSQ